MCKSQGFVSVCTTSRGGGGENGLCRAVPPTEGRGRKRSMPCRAKVCAFMEATNDSLGGLLMDVPFLYACLICNFMMVFGDFIT